MLYIESTTYTYTHAHTHMKNAVYNTFCEKFHFHKVTRSKIFGSYGRYDEEVAAHFPC